jgi:hypothetical protein
MSTISVDIAPVSHGNSRWTKATGALLLLITVLAVYVNVRIAMEGGSPVVPVMIVGALALALGIAALIRPQRLLFFAIAVFAALALLGSWPHELANVTSGNVEKSIFGVLMLTAIAAAVIVAAIAALTWSRADGG